MSKERQTSIAGGLSRGAAASLAALVLVAVGSVGPWVTAPGESVGGLDNDGSVTLGLAIVGAVYLIFSRGPHWAPMAMVAFFIGAIAVIDIIDISDSSGFGIDPGWGVYLVALASVGLLGAALSALRTESAGDPIGLAGKLLLGLGALLLVLVVVVTLTDDTEVARTVPAPEPVQLEEP